MKYKTIDLKPYSMEHWFRDEKQLTMHTKLMSSLKWNMVLPYLLEVVLLQFSFWILPRIFSLVYRAPSIDSDEEEVPTSDFTTQTIPHPPVDIQSPPTPAQEDAEISEPSENDSNQDLYLPPDPSNISSQMHEQISAMQKEMQLQMQQKLQQHLQHVSLNEETAAEAAVSNQAQHSAQISQEQVVTMKMERRVEASSSHSEFTSSQLATSSHSESGVEASGVLEVALGNGTQSQTNIESIPTEEEE